MLENVDENAPFWLLEAWFGKVELAAWTVADSEALCLLLRVSL